MTRRSHSYCPCISCACNRVMAIQEARVEKIRGRHKIVLAWIQKDCDRKLARHQEDWSAERERLNELLRAEDRKYTRELKKIAAALLVLLFSGGIACLQSM